MLSKEEKKLLKKYKANIVEHGECESCGSLEPCSLMFLDSGEYWCEDCAADLNYFDDGVYFESLLPDEEIMVKLHNIEKRLKVKYFINRIKELTGKNVIMYDKKKK